MGAEERTANLDFVLIVLFSRDPRQERGQSLAVTAVMRGKFLETAKRLLGPVNGALRNPASLGSREEPVGRTARGNIDGLSQTRGSRQTKNLPGELLVEPQR